MVPTLLHYGEAFLAGCGPEDPMRSEKCYSWIAPLAWSKRRSCLFSMSTQ